MGKGGKKKSAAPASAPESHLQSATVKVKNESLEQILSGLTITERKFLQEQVTIELPRRASAAAGGKANSQAQKKETAAQLQQMLT